MPAVDVDELNEDLKNVVLLVICVYRNHSQVVLLLFIVSPTINMETHHTPLMLTNGILALTALTLSRFAWEFAQQNLLEIRDVGPPYYSLAWTKYDVARILPAQPVVVVASAPKRFTEQSFCQCLHPLFLRAH